MKSLGRHPSPQIISKFVFVTRTFNIYSLSSFQIYNTVLLAIVTMLYITYMCTSEGPIQFITEGTFWPLTLSPPTSGNDQYFFSVFINITTSPIQQAKTPLYYYFIFSPKLPEDFTVHFPYQFKNLSCKFFVDFEFMDEFWGKSTADRASIFQYGIFIAQWFRPFECIFNKDIFSVEFPQCFTCFNAIVNGNFYIKISDSCLYIEVPSCFSHV